MSLFTSSTFSAFSLASSNFLTASSYVSPITFGTIVVSVPLLTLTDTLFFVLFYILRCNLVFAHIFFQLHSLCYNLHLFFTYSSFNLANSAFASSSVFPTRLGI